MLVPISGKGSDVATREQAVGTSTRRVCQRVRCALIGSPSGSGRLPHMSSAMMDLVLEDPQTREQYYCQHLHQPRGWLGAWVSHGNQPLQETSNSVSMYPPLSVMSPVAVIVCCHPPPSPLLNDVSMMSTYLCAFWTLVFLLE
jgi:hypothetical protein